MILLCFFKLVKSSQENVGINHPALPRKRKAPQQFEVGSGEGYHSLAVDLYRQHYYEALDGAIATIESH